MKLRPIFFSLLVALVGVSPLIATAMQDEDVRGAFMTTRPKVSPKPTATKTSRRRPKPVVSGNNPNPGPSPSPVTPQKLNTARMGLGLTLFMRDSNGLAIRTDPAHEFVKGDHVRFLIETSADGYLYVFNTTDGGQPVELTVSLIRGSSESPRQGLGPSP